MRIYVYRHLDFTAGVMTINFIVFPQTLSLNHKMYLQLNKFNQFGILSIGSFKTRHNVMYVEL